MTDPTRRRVPDAPTYTCKACGRRGHKAATCDFLAQSVFLQKYLAKGHVHSADIEAAEARWLDRWSSKGGNPGALTPKKVLLAYTAKYGHPLEQLEDEIDWNCWPVEDRLE